MAPTATTTKAPPTTVHEALDVLDQAAQRIGRTADALRTELAALGARGPTNITATLPALKAERAAALAAAVRKGVEPQLADLDRKLAAAHARVEAIGLEVAACETATRDVAAERVELLRSRSAELTKLAQKATDELTERQRITRAAAVEEQLADHHARAAIGLGVASLTPRPRPIGPQDRDELDALTTADREAVAEYRAQFALGTPERRAAVERVASESVS